MSVGIVQQCIGRVRSPQNPGFEYLFAGSLEGPPSGGATPAPDGDTSNPSQQARAATVLVVEDQEQVLRVTERALTRSGFTVLATGSSEEALALLDAGESVDVLLSDVVMPKVSGLELARRARERRPDLKIVFMSGYSDDDLRRYDLDSARIVQKPFTAVELLAAVEDSISGRALDERSRDSSSRAA